jgi:hypothetical protein
MRLLGADPIQPQVGVLGNADELAQHLSVGVPDEP